MIQRTTLLLLLTGQLLPAALLWAQPPTGLPAGRAIVFPDVPGYRTLVTDLHTHSVFSDGSVWPDIRVEEAIRDGLDVLAITEHLGYEPHAEDVPFEDKNRAYEVAVEFLEELREEDAPGADLILVHGSEITREMPPGHANAIFIEDANRLTEGDDLELFREANRQGAFVFWNHPSWIGQRPDGVARLDEIHRRLIDEGLLHGIEVVNDWTYSDAALQIALEHDLTILGTSDIHGLVDWRYDIPNEGHRPVTLVFAEERSEPAVKEALFAGRTVAWFTNLLVGHGEYLVPLVEASLVLDEAFYPAEKSVLTLWIENRSSASWVLRNVGPFELYNQGNVVTLDAHTRTRIQVITGERLESASLELEVLNALTAPRTHPRIELKVEEIALLEADED